MDKKCGRTLAVLFDLDGTLADSLSLIRHTYFKVFTEMNIPWGNDDVMRWIGRPLADIADHFAGGERAGNFIERYQHHYHRDHDLYISLFPGTAEMLKELREKGIKTGVVTSKGRPGTMRTVEFTGIAPDLDVIVTAHDVERHKPLPDPVRKALEMLGVGAAWAVYVGDSHFDLEAGKAAGVRVLGVSWGLCSAGELMRYEPDGVLGSWDELRLYI
ncbi:MAG: HAD-IA family hydrolase [Peptococcaceae bacterium]|nr:HAD-IA family hydrolase [Peptococcaceae bacterium]